MVLSSQIKPNTQVVCSDSGRFGTVDRMEGRDIIKLSADDKGQHHYIPLQWVASVDDKIHLDRTLAQATREWSDKPSFKSEATPVASRTDKPAQTSKTDKPSSASL